jgi:hypothetical protein
VSTPVTPTPSTTADARAKPPYAAVGLLGLVLLTATTLLFAVLIVAMFPDELGFIATPLVVMSVVTLLTWRRDATWVRVLAIIATLALGAMMFWVSFGLVHPTSFFDFVPALMFVLGFVLSLVGNITTVARRRTSRPTTAGEQRLQQVVVALVGIAVVVSGTMHLLGRDAIDPATVPDAIPVAMSDFEFDPATIDASSRSQLLVHNGDTFVHDFTVPELDVAVTISPGSSALVDLPVASGTYVVYCTLHSDTSDPDPSPDDAMVARLTVR